MRAQVVRYEVSQQPHLLGSSVFGYNDAYCRLQPYLRRWRLALGTHGAASDSRPPTSCANHRVSSSDHGTAGSSAGAKGATGRPAFTPHIIAADVSRAFDGIDVPKMLAILEPVLRAPEYVVVKYAEVRGSKATPWYTDSRSRHRSAATCIVAIRHCVAILQNPDIVL